MSHFTAEFITKMLSEYDVLVRGAIGKGSLDSFLEKEAEIVSDIRQRFIYIV
jgi:hypothetical protein